MLFDIALLVFPALFSVLVTRLVKTQREKENFLRILKLAEEAVLFAQDAFPQSKGVEKLKKAMEYLKGALAQAGIKISDSEAEAKVRAAYQRLQGEALERVLQALGRRIGG